MRTMLIVNAISLSDTCVSNSFCFWAFIRPIYCGPLKGPLTILNKINFSNLFLFCVETMSLKWRYRSTKSGPRNPNFQFKVSILVEESRILTRLTTVAAMKVFEINNGNTLSLALFTDVANSKYFSIHYIAHNLENLSNEFIFLCHSLRVHNYMFWLMLV